MGALDMGMAPGILPGRNTLSSGSSLFSDIWPNLPSEVGADTKQILQNAADGKVDTLFLLGADPISDFPDRPLAESALRNAGIVIAVDLWLFIIPCQSFVNLINETASLIFDHTYPCQ